MSKDHPTLAEKLLAKVDAPHINHSTLAEIARQGVEGMRSYANHRIQHSGEAQQMLNGFHINEQPIERQQPYQYRSNANAEFEQERARQVQLQENHTLGHTLGTLLHNNWGRQSYARDSQNNFRSYAQGRHNNFGSYANDQQNSQQREQTTPHTNFSSHVRF